MLNDFLDVITQSYIYRLRFGHDEWESRWENLCTKELYEITDPILKNLSTIMSCHLDRVNSFIFKSKKTLENFKVLLAEKDHEIMKIKRNDTE